VTRQTLGFYRESTFPDELDLPTLVESVLKLYSNKFKTKKIFVNRNFSDCPPLQGWAGELKQVVSNLVSNAIDAAGANGTVAVSVANANIPDGQALELKVEDDGPGIAPEHLERVFEPFFTTKKEVGTGLGLYVSKQIVERHGGTIEVYSNNSGNAVHRTTFRVVLPCSVSVPLRAAKTA